MADVDPRTYGEFARRAGAVPVEFEKEKKMRKNYVWVVELVVRKNRHMCYVAKEAHVLKPAAVRALREYKKSNPGEEFQVVKYHSDI